MIKVLHIIINKENERKDILRLVDARLHNRYDELVNHMRCIDIEYKEDICFEKLSGYDFKNMIHLHINKNKDTFSKECIKFIEKISLYDLQNEISANRIFHKYLRGDNNGCGHNRN
jgi:hypothetical protein